MFSLRKYAYKTGEERKYTRNRSERKLKTKNGSR